MHYHGQTMSHYGRWISNGSDFWGDVEPSTSKQAYNPYWIGTRLHAAYSCHLWSGMDKSDTMFRHRPFAEPCESFTGSRDSLNWKMAFKPMTLLRITNKFWRQSEKVIQTELFQRISVPWLLAAYLITPKICLNSDILGKEMGVEKSLQKTRHQQSHQLIYKQEAISHCGLAESC